MIRFAIDAAAIVVAFGAGKVYGARLEAKTVAEYVKAKADVDKLYATVVADFKGALARVRKFL